jgi:hypothetical protein
MLGKSRPRGNSHSYRAPRLLSPSLTPCRPSGHDGSRRHGCVRRVALVGECATARLLGPALANDP